MNLINKKNGLYIIENIYSLNRTTLSEIIQKIKININDSILFQYIESYNIDEKYVDIENDSSIDFMLEGYLEGFLNLKNQSTKDKIETDIKNLLKNNGDEDILYSKFISDPFSMKTNLLNKIKYIIYSNILSESILSVPSFIYDKVIFKNRCILQNDYDSYSIVKDERFNVLWYEVKNNVDIINAIKSDNFFKGIITDSKNQLKNFYCAFWHYETASDYNLAIYYNNINCSVERSVNEISKLLSMRI